ncbi:hypothetical protein [Dokdonella sp.]|uniref:hypothetical protein n=1 Tax=Dokdonella sp. TaxID=2291710 RepID=UPI00352709D9
MDLAFNQEEQAFMKKFALLLRDKLPDDIRLRVHLRRPQPYSRRHRTGKNTNARGCAPAWPAEFGGTGWSKARQFIP